MPLSPSVRRPAAAAALGAALLTTAFSGVAGAATISKQATLKPGATIPVDFAGFKEPSNNKLPSGYVILKRTATMHPGEVHVFNGKPITAKITAPNGYTLLTVKEKGRIDWRAPSGFIGKRSMTVTLTSESVDPGKDTANGTYYVLAKRGNTNA